MLHHQLAWYVGGPVLGLCVVAIRLLLNERLGVTGGFSAIVEFAERRVPSLDWRAWFVIGIVAGSALYALIAGGPDFHGYGWLTRTFDGGSRFLVAPILVLAGVLVGFGAKTAKGCTSGNGLSGSAMTSPASFAATATFFATAIVVSFVIKALT
jgi:uncharacterized membrane protein YedE/YeeE